MGDMPQPGSEAPSSASLSHESQSLTAVEPGYYVPVPPPRGKRRLWLIGGGILAAVLAMIAGVIVSGSGSGGDHGVAASPNPPTVSGTTPGRVFTHVPDGCSLIKPATIATYAPGTTCATPAYRSSSATLIAAKSYWNLATMSRKNYFVILMADLILNPQVPSVYSTSKSQMTDRFSTWADIRDEHPVAGLGDEAYVAYGSSAMQGRAVLLARWGNAEINITYDGIHSSPGFVSTPYSQQETEAAVVAAAHDIFNSLS